MLTAAGSALVAGSTPEKTMAMQNVKVLKGFYISGQLQEVGSIVALSKSLALDLIGRQKAEATDDEPRKAPAKAAEKPAEKPAATPAGAGAGAGK